MLYLVSMQNHFLADALKHWTGDEIFMWIYLHFSLERKFFVGKQCKSAAKGDFFMLKMNLDLQKISIFNWKKV